MLIFRSAWKHKHILTNIVVLAFRSSWKQVCIIMRVELLIFRSPWKHNRIVMRFMRLISRSLRNQKQIPMSMSCSLSPIISDFGNIISIVYILFMCSIRLFMLMALLNVVMWKNIMNTTAHVEVGAHDAQHVDLSYETMSRSKLHIYLTGKTVWSWSFGTGSKCFLQAKAVTEVFVWANLIGVELGE